MNKISSPIVFFGSGPVATKSVEHLSKCFHLDAIVTKPSTEQDMANADIPEGTCIYKVSNKSELDELIDSNLFEDKLGVVVDFGIIISQKAIDYFQMGIVNSHFSLLPEWRGADPIAFSVLSGQKKTGVSLMLINEKLDEGRLIYQQALDIDSNETTPSLTAKLISLSNSLLEAKLPAYLAGSITPFDQPTSNISYSRKLTKQDGVLDFTKPAEILEREIRAFTDWPKSRTTLGDIEAIITKAHVMKTSRKPAGKTEIIDGILVIHCAKNSLAIDRLKPAGKRDMDARSFLAGYKDRVV